MERLQKLIGNNDITSVEVVENNSEYSIVFTFQWEMDCGCFSYIRSSNLTILATNINDVIMNLSLKGKVFQLIEHHKEYSGELIDLRGDKNDSKRKI